MYREKDSSTEVDKAIDYLNGMSEDDRIKAIAHFAYTRMYCIDCHKVSTVYVSNYCQCEIKFDRKLTTIFEKVMYQIQRVFSFVDIEMIPVKNNIGEQYFKLNIKEKNHELKI